METSNWNFSSVEYEGEQVAYRLRIKPLDLKYTLVSIYSMEYIAEDDLEKLKDIANIINAGHGFNAEIMYRKIGIYTCQESKGGWQRYEE